MFKNLGFRKNFDDQIFRVDIRAENPKK